QQQQQPLPSSLAATQNQTELFQSEEDGIRLNVPQGWQVHDINNTGPVFAEESTRGYGILAQLCLTKEEGRQGSANSTANGCQVAQENVIHVVRYPNLEAGGVQDANSSGSSSSATTNTTTTADGSTPAIGASFNNMTPATSAAVTAVEGDSTTIDNILAYHLQKLQEVGYRNIQFVNNLATTVNLTLSQANQTITTLPAKFGEIVYTTASAPGEIKRGYFILTATNATAPNLGITKGYSLFYEGSGNSTETRTAGSFGSVSLPLPVRQVFDSFGLITVATSTEPLAVSINSRTLEGEGVAPATFEFESNVRGGAAPYAYSWDFDEEEGEESNERVVLHTFDEAGTYNVRVTVTDSSGQNASDSVEIVVEEVESEEVEEQPPGAEEGDNPASDSAGIDDVVNDFIDDLFSGLGLR
ncbi:MAG: PKD domain-containing protein, partial [Thermoproteota archaeon]|nr:PKD domain-containing protein [Thermoproteota archaeon]